MQARYDLAVEAIKTFHTGVSEDFLLKEEQFKELRDRLLKSASDFYGKLGALLGKETDLASRRALAQANFEVAELTGKVGRPEDALAAHRQVLAAREALAAEPAADPELKADVGRSLTAVALLLGAPERPTRRRRPTGRRRRCWSNWPRRSRGPPRCGLPGLPAGGGSAGCFTGRAVRRGLGAVPPGTRRPGGAGRRPRGRGRIAADLADTINRIGWLLSQTGKLAEAEAEHRKALALYQKLADDNPAVTEFRNSLASSHDTLGILLVRRAGQRRRRPSTARRWPSTRSWPTTTPPSPNSAATWCQSTATSAYCCRRWAIRGGGGRAPQVTGSCPEAGRRRPRRHRIPPQPGVISRQPRLPAEEDGQAGGGGGRVPPESRSLQKLADDNPKVPDYRLGVALALKNLGDVALMLGRETESRDAYERAIALGETLVAGYPTTTVCRRNLAGSLHRRGLARRASG